MLMVIKKAPQGELINFMLVTYFNKNATSIMLLDNADAIHLNNHTIQSMPGKSTLAYMDVGT